MSYMLPLAVYLSIHLGEGTTLTMNQGTAFGRFSRLSITEGTYSVRCPSAIAWKSVMLLFLEAEDRLEQP